jgi:hypothetical protein
MALPCLLYAIEALPLTKTNLRNIEHPWSRVFMKIFSTFDVKIVADCQSYIGYTTVEQLACFRKNKFVNLLPDSPNSIIRTLYKVLSEQPENTW